MSKILLKQLFFLLLFFFAVFTCIINPQTVLAHLDPPGERAYRETIWVSDVRYTANSNDWAKRLTLDIGISQNKHTLRPYERTILLGEDLKTIPSNNLLAKPEIIYDHFNCSPVERPIVISTSLIRLTSEYDFKKKTTINFNGTDMITGKTAKNDSYSVRYIIKTEPVQQFDGYCNETNPLPEGEFRLEKQLPPPVLPPFEDFTPTEEPDCECIKEEFLEKTITILIIVIIIIFLFIIFKRKR